MRIEAVNSWEQRAELGDAPAMPTFNSRQLEEHRVDAHLCVLDGDGKVIAQCSLWWRETPQLGDDRVGAIGHYGSVESEAAAALLTEATALLRAEQRTIAIGPMDGNTWRHYRFVIANGSILPAEPAFFLEPTNPAEWPRQFEAAGFKPVARYYSALNNDLARSDERIAPLAAKLESAGVRIRSAIGTALEEQLERIYQVSRIAFLHNFLYTELPEEAFLAQYSPLLGRLRPELILLAERGPELVGYLFAIPDFAQAARGDAIDTIIVKTVAILPYPELRGLGGLLVARAHQAGHKLGFRRAIHALMHENNISRNISRHYAETMREYALFGLELRT